MVKVKLKDIIHQSKCGCPDCKMEGIPQLRPQWKARKNNKGKPFGMHSKGHGSKKLGG